MGLLTFLKNFLFPQKSKKSTTKASKKPTRKRVRKKPAKVKPVKLDEFEKLEYDTIEFDVTDSVNIEHDIDRILDFLNSFPKELKEEVMEVLEKDDEGYDKALFLTGITNDGLEELHYMILCKVVTLEEKGLMLVYSKNVDLLSLYMSNMTTMPYEKIKKNFTDKK